MKAMILAAGKGTRVRPITDYVPKPMIPIVNRPVMEFLVELLREHGFDQILVSTAHLAGQIENYFGDGSRFGVQIGYSFEGYHRDGQVEPEGLGSAGGLKKAHEFAGFYDSTFVVVCGDAIHDLDLGRALAFHADRKAIATIILKEVPPEEVHRYGIVQTEPDGRIVRFQEKPRMEEAVSTTANTGIYLFEPEIFDHIPSGRPFDIGGDLFPLLAARGLPFYGCAFPFSWIDNGSTPDYWRATQMVLKGEFKVDMPGKLLAPAVWGGVNLNVDLSQVQGPLHIGAGTRIEKGARILGPTVIGRNCVIEAGARIRASVIGSYTRVTGFAELSEKIVSGRFCVDRHGHNVDLARHGYAFVIDDARERRDTWTEDQQALIDFLRSEMPPGPPEP
jgi:mannose-1-phosphate guanylyltransferase